MNKSKRAILKTALVAWEVRKPSSVEENLDRAEKLIVAARKQGARAMGFVEYFSLLGTPLQAKDAA